MSDEQLMRFALEPGARSLAAWRSAGRRDRADRRRDRRRGIQSADCDARSDRARRDRRDAPGGGAIGNYRLTGATLYVTIEPCQMCVGAMIHARIGRLVYGAAEPKAGAIESAMRAHEHPALNHRIEVTGRVSESDCRELVQEFFAEKRCQTEDRRLHTAD